MTDTLIYKMAFAALRGMNRALAGELLSRVGSERDFFEMPDRRLGAVMGFSNKLFDGTYRATILEQARREADFVNANGIRALYYTDDDYPVRLADCDDAPLMLYGLGKCDLNRGHVVAVVGNPHATPYGMDFVNRLIADMAKHLAEPVTVVSGLAFGIDAAAHTASLKCAVPTVGVLGHGLNTIYPAQHRSLAADIVRSGGMLVSEYRSCDAIHKGNFVARNRIVAGMCDCLVVAESARKGGALITANIASGYNRDVFALPGRISDRYSEGCNRLIASNVAALVQDVSDVAQAMNWKLKETEAEQPSLFPDLSEEELAVVEYLTNHGEAQLNQLTIAMNQSVGRMMSLLVDMEFKGLVLTFPGGKYRLA